MPIAINVTSSPSQTSGSNPQDSLRVNLRRMAVAAALVTYGGESRAAAIPSQTSKLLQNLARNFHDEAASPTIRFQAEVDDVVAVIDDIARRAACSEHAVLYIAGDSSSSLPQIAGNVEFYVAGNAGTEWFVFTSGTPLNVMTAAILQRADLTGVSATVCAVNPDRIELRSRASGCDQFVSVSQLAGESPLFRRRVVGGESYLVVADFGCGAPSSECTQPATVFLSTGQPLRPGAPTVTLELRSNFGSMSMTLASGTTQQNIIGIFDWASQYPAMLGIQASQSPSNPDRIELRSVAFGAEAFVSVVQRDGAAPLIYGLPVGGIGTYSEQVTGRNGLSGDVNCDFSVDATDLSLVFLEWGDCGDLNEICEGDVDDNGKVNVDDLVRVIMNWGSSGP